MTRKNGHEFHDATNGETVRANEDYAEAAHGLNGKHIVLGVSGSIAAYKAAELASRLVQAGATVDVVLTEAAGRFIGPLTFQALTHRSVVTDLLAADSELGIDHVALAKRADALLVAPATANIIAALAHGFAGDALTTTALSTTAPIIVCPAMESDMYENTATKANVATLEERGIVIVPPTAGRLASGLYGTGRLADVDTIVGTLRHVLGRRGDLAGRRVVVTAGGTREAIDPVRFITNRSSGKMGHALAEAARDRGAAVTLITTADVPAHIAAGTDVQTVATAKQMHRAVADAVENADALVMAAAVADYRPERVADEKMKKRDGDDDTLSLTLVRNPDILSSVKGPTVRVGFAAETENLLDNARAKLAKKRLHLIVANDVSAPDSGFDTDTNRVTLLHAKGGLEQLPTLPKTDVAHVILDRVARLLPAEN